MLNELPIEIYIIIYKFLNPISIPFVRKKTCFWCEKCGEFLKGGDWFFNLEFDEFYLLYECYYCKHENIFTDTSICDLVIKQDSS